MSEPGLDQLDQPMSRRAARRSLLYAGAVIGVVLAILVGAAGYQFWQANKTTAALCVFRADLQSRVDGGEAFLRDHPRGIPGISGKAIRDSLNNQRRTINSLSGLSCPPVPDPTSTP
jgi:hypothetical protein